MFLRNGFFFDQNTEFKSLFRNKNDGRKYQNEFDTMPDRNSRQFVMVFQWHFDHLSKIL